ncbi:hypothetical protein [Sphingomonas sp.]|uniref:hypothetical protein n=1 Tax=Sphingomonas sp. TaxID=28214 RepID=UPI0017AEDCCC|nr:hypothetical protein [Sphingomonas sp.]MBA3510675.1 hypothetical protein [Sphingomonas sp.]
MSDQVNFSPISQADLDEHWFSLRLKTWRAVRKAVSTLNVEQKLIADRIDMDPGQFNRVLSGKKSNVTLRTLHNIARAANYRLQIALVPLADLRKPNYSYEARKRENASIFERLTRDEVNDTPDPWITSHSRQPDAIGA